VSRCCHAASSTTHCGSFASPPCKKRIKVERLSDLRDEGMTAGALAASNYRQKYLPQPKGVSLKSILSVRNKNSAATTILCESATSRKGGAKSVSRAQPLVTMPLMVACR
jgi:hypothetical protein